MSTLDIKLLNQIPEQTIETKDYKFIGITKEDGIYTYDKDGNLVKVSTGTKDIIMYKGDVEPEDKTKIWFDTSGTKVLIKAYNNDKSIWEVIEGVNHNSLKNYNIEEFQYFSYTFDNWDSPIPLSLNELISINSTNTNMEYGNDYVLLKANHTYYISIQLRIKCSSTSGRTAIHLCNSETKVSLGLDYAYYNYLANSNSLASSKDISVIHFKPLEDIKLGIKPTVLEGDLSISSLSFNVFEINKTVIENEVKQVDEQYGLEDGDIGEIKGFMGNTAPRHYLICDGTVYKIADYQELADHIKDKFGSYNYWGGDGVETFAVPDLRGEFLRGTGTAERNTGTGANVGQHQDGTLIPFVQPHNKNLIYDNGNSNSIKNADSLVFNDDSTERYYISSGTKLDDNKEPSITIRPTNTSVLWCIKYEHTYFMKYSPKLGYMKQDVLLSDEVKDIGEYQLTNPLKNYDLIMIEYATKDISTPIRQYCSNIINVNDINYDDYSVPMCITRSKKEEDKEDIITWWCTNMFIKLSEQKINIFAYDCSNGVELYITKIIGFKCTEKTLGEIGSGGSSDQDLTDEELNTLINNSFINGGE